MDDDDLLALVTRISGAFESYALRTFKVWRKSGVDGGERELLVTIYDAGQSAGTNRYMVEVKPVDDMGEDDPPYSLSNPEPTVELALDGVHWNVFDRLSEPSSA